VIWTIREGVTEHLHFDTRQYSHILWTDAADLSAKLKVRIGAVLGYGASARWLFMKGGWPETFYYTIHTGHQTLCNNINVLMVARGA